MFSDQQNFLWDFESLEEIRNNPHPKNLLQAACIIRRLLMDDGTPLVHKVAGPIKYNVKFEFVPLDLQNNLPFKEDLLFLYENISIFGKSSSKKSVKIDQFLSAKVVFSHGNAISVGDLIRYCANVAGGVHKGEPKGKFNSKIIHDYAKHIQINGYNYPLEIIRNIIDIMLESLKPIYDIIKA